MSTFPFTVKRRSPTLVTPATQTPREIKPLSDLDDQDVSRFHLPVINYYRKCPSPEQKDPAGILRVALSRALVYYYPLAGRLIEGENRKLMVDCNGEGVLFVEADADVGLEQLGFTVRQLPSPYMEEFLYPVAGSGGIVGCPLMLIQVTHLICGGFVLAIRFNYCITDAVGMAQLLNVVAEMARGELTPSVFPTWDRQILNARTKPRITCRHKEYEQVEQTDQSVLTMANNNLVSRSFFFGPRELKSLQKNNLPHDIEPYSPFDLVTACVWRSRTIALQIKSNEFVTLTNVFNIQGKNYLNVPDGYYGGTSVTTTAVAMVGNLRNNTLGYAMGLVRQANRKVSEEYVRSMIDLMVIKARPSPCSGPLNFIVSDASSVRFGEADFGWGKAVSGGISLEPTPCESVYTSVFNAKAEEGISVPICLPVTAMRRFEDEIGKLMQEELDDSIGISRL